VSWAILATAPDQLVAEMWRGLLLAEGVQAFVRSGDASSFLGVSTLPCRLMVAEEDLERAQEVLVEQLQDVDGE
jgi:hypothetical protein